jgi:predicted protein tyrosine phosphatase
MLFEMAALTTNSESAHDHGTPSENEELETMDTANNREHQHRKKEKRRMRSARKKRRRRTNKN